MFPCPQHATNQHPGQHCTHRLAHERTLFEGRWHLFLLSFLCPLGPCPTIPEQQLVQNSTAWNLIGGSNTAGRSGRGKLVWLDWNCLWREIGRSRGSPRAPPRLHWHCPDLEIVSVHKSPPPVPIPEEGSLMGLAKLLGTISFLVRLQWLVLTNSVLSVTLAGPAPLRQSAI